MFKWYFAGSFVLLLACGDRNTSLSGSEISNVDDFVKAFPEMQLPATVYDTSLERIGDTLTINRAVFTQYIADSLVPENNKVAIRPVGRIEKTDEKYLLAKMIRDNVTTLGVYVFNNKNEFIGGRDLLKDNNKDGYRHSINISREPTFNVNKEQEKNNQLRYTRVGYAFNKDAGFVVVVNDSNEDPGKRDSIINPIDTLGKLNPYSGDYIKDKKNFISIRDGRDEQNYMFFIHFEKNNGDCIGELKGEMNIKDEKTGQYTASGDPCVINFKFSGSTIKVKEEGTCGNHRGIKCFFDDSYKKQAPPKTKKKK